jgi:hypothetical protein
MSDHKQNYETRKKRFLRSSSNGSFRQAQAQQLQKEIDKLALLLYEAKKQSDRIQAVADAMGDAVFSVHAPAKILLS